MTGQPRPAFFRSRERCGEMTFQNDRQRVYIETAMARPPIPPAAFAGLFSLTLLDLQSYLRPPAPVVKGLSLNIRDRNATSSAGTSMARPLLFRSPNSPSGIRRPTEEWHRRPKRNKNTIRADPRPPDPVSVFY